jgi:hypothetical protein
MARPMLNEIVSNFRTMECIWKTKQAKAPLTPDKGGGVLFFYIIGKGVREQEKRQIREVNVVLALQQCFE